MILDWLRGETVMAARACAMTILRGFLDKNLQIFLTDLRDVRKNVVNYNFSLLGTLFQNTPKSHLSTYLM